MGRKAKKRGAETSLDIIQLNTIAQAIEDVLRYELGLPLEGALSDEAASIYDDAIEYLFQNPKLKKRYYNINKLDWLREVEYARE